MRTVLLGVFLIGCATSPRGPAWPKDRAPEVDGGESLEPRVASAAAVEQSKDSSPAVEVPPAIETVTPAITPPVAEPLPTPALPDIATDDDDVIITEELVIEIEDD
jgi:hypothetical protein